MGKRILLVIVCIFLTVSFAFAQGESSTEPQRAEMKKLEQMIGQWKGTGWMQQGAKRETFAGTENVQKKLNGLALLVEGRFTSKIPPTNEEKVIHETLAVLSYDVKKKGYRFSTYLANGNAGEQELKLVEGGWQWGLEFPGGSIRYITKMSENIWFEIGEITQDGGKTWRKFFEMELQRVK